MEKLQKHGRKAIKNINKEELPFITLQEMIQSLQFHFSSFINDQQLIYYNKYGWWKCIDELMKKGGRHPSLEREYRVERERV